MKQITRAISKTTRTYRGDFRRLTDLVRTTIVFQKFADIQFFLQLLRTHAVSCDRHVAQSLSRTQHAARPSLDSVMQVIRIRNRFDPGLSSKQLFGGYRDLALKVKMGFVCVQSSCAADRVKFVAVTRWADANVKTLVFEIQLHLDAVRLDDDACDSAAHHRLYVESRNLLSV